jgi:hypothetical protein
MINKIFEIGTCKTGTSSLGVALDLLGYRVAGWERATVKDFRSGGVDNIIREFDHYDAFQDAPWHNIDVDIIDDLFPNSKFILLERNDNDWFNSLVDHWRRKNYIIGGGHKEYINYLYNPEKIKYDNISQKHLKYSLNIEYFKNRPDDLLVMNICEGDGWDKLCQFLNVDIPSIPFPHKNIASNVWDRIQIRKQKYIQNSRANKPLLDKI